MKPLSGLSLFLVTIALSFGAAMDALDISVANVCIPEISGDLDVTPFRGTWIITSYALTNAITILLAGFLAKRFGEVRLFTLSVILFTITSLLCGLAANFEMLVFFRLLQGIAAGPLVPLCQSLLLQSFPAKKRTVGLSVSLMILIIAPIFGPVVGGAITETMSWRWIFFLNIPIGIFCAGLTWVILKGRETELSHPPIDILGLILLTVGVGAFQLFLSLGPNHGWLRSSAVSWSLATAILTLGLFLPWSLRHKSPIIEFRLFKRRNYSIANILSFAAYIAFYAGFVLYPIWLQIELGYTALWAGYALVPLGAAILFLTPITGIFVEILKVDLRLILTVSFIIFAASFVWAGQYTNDASFVSLLYPRILLGTALGLFCIPSYIVAASGIPQKDLANAVSVFNFGRVIGIGIGTAIGISSLQMMQKIHYQNLLPRISLANQQLGSLLHKLSHAGYSANARFGYIHEQLSSQSITLALNSLFISTALLFVALIGLIWLLRPPFPQLEAEYL